ncbi:SDR family oxidoreductase [Opitutales bacterium]|nr:SDR family oxidoreductase [Opitutales bacterium]
MMINEIFNISKKNVIITGASRGIGFYLCNSLSSLGCNVYGISRTEVKDVSFTSCVCDLSYERNIQNIFHDLGKKLGTIDCLINVAGISKKVEDENDVNVFKLTVNLNLISSYICSRFASKYMKAGSTIINFASIGGMQGFPSNPGYTSSKAGIISLSQSLAIDYQCIGIRVNSVSPGYILTDMTSASFNKLKLRKERLDRMIIKRWGEPADILGIIIYLCSDASSYVTGQNFVIDGGWTSKGL